jgi:hypothetical protein
MSRRYSDLSGLISSGRAEKGVPKSRAEILAALLRKRAAAWQNGMSDLEATLRNQISWSLPIEKPAESEDEADDSSDSSPPAASNEA